MFLGRVVAPGEPLWLDEDREFALAWQAEEQEACPGCGNPRSETFDQRFEWDWDVTALKCHACAARERRASLYESPVERAGLFFTVRRDG